MLPFVGLVKQLSIIFVVFFFFSVDVYTRDKPSEGGGDVCRV